jgi:hypothetical protein
VVVERDDWGREGFRCGTDMNGATELRLIDAERSEVGLVRPELVCDSNDNDASVPKAVDDSFDVNTALVADGVEIGVVDVV